MYDFSYGFFFNPLSKIKNNSLKLIYISNIYYTIFLNKIFAALQH